MRWVMTGCGADGLAAREDVEACIGDLPAQDPVAVCADQDGARHGAPAGHLRAITDTQPRVLVQTEPTFAGHNALYERIELHEAL